MKKLRLKALALGANEMLTREQLKNVFGGSGGSGSGSGSGKCETSECSSNANCSAKFPTCSIVNCDSDPNVKIGNCICTTNATGC